VALGETTMRTLLLLMMICIGNMAAASEQSQVNWPLDYENKSTNSFVWDDRLDELIKTTIPTKLTNNLRSGLGGPPDPVYVTSERYFSASACLPHACIFQKSFYWLDTLTGEALGAVWVGSLELGSMNIKVEKIPPEAKAQLLRWISERDINPNEVKFYNANNKVSILPASEFQPKKKYAPNKNGPSFDCQKASTSVEKSICANEEIAKLDLKVSSLFNEMRINRSDLKGLNELVNFQKKWLSKRNAECANSNEIEICLRDSYEMQYSSLMNWSPGR